MTIRSAVRATLGVALILSGTGTESLAHEIAGVQSYYACKPTLARAFLRSPNPGAGREDYPLRVLDTNGTPTGEHIVVITVENASAFDARVTAAGFTWPFETGPIELVQLNRSYNELTIREYERVASDQRITRSCRRSPSASHTARSNSRFGRMSTAYLGFRIRC